MAKIEVGETLGIRGTLDVSGGTVTLKDDQVPRAKLAREDNSVLTIPLTNLRVHDAVMTELPNAAANDDLGVVMATWNTDAPTCQAGDIGGTASTRYAFFSHRITEDWILGETMTIRFYAGMLTTVADTSCTLDLECYVNNGDGTVGSDICATAVQDINSVTLANKDFTITPGSISNGDELLFRIAIAYSDTGDAGVMIPEIGSIKMLRDIRP